MIYFLAGAFFGYCLGKEKIPFWLVILDSLVYGEREDRIYIRAHNKFNTKHVHLFHLSNMYTWINYFSCSYKIRCSCNVIYLIIGGLYLCLDLIKNNSS